ncbi:MAG: phosphate ABC transporter substrate-binding protein PstS [Acidimicrobiales bacterium]|jgi:phosphate transport system substrate-binding protein
MATAETSRCTGRKASPWALAATGALVAAVSAAGGVLGAGSAFAANRPAAHKTVVTKAADAPPSAKVALSETGSTLLYPLFQLWATAYHKMYSNITITPQGTGSGTGISDAEGGSINIGASDAYLSATDFAQYPGIMNIPLAISAQMINYNVKGVPASTHLKLDGGVLAAIYEGHITNWDDPHIKSLNPGVNLPNEKIVALHRSDSSGDTFIFSTYLSDSNPSGWGKSIGFGTSISFPSISNALAEEGNGGMVTGCDKTPGCIAYIGISYRKETQAGHLGEAMLQNRAGTFHLPVASTIISEAGAAYEQTPPDEALSLVDDGAKGGYPIINYEYAIIPPKEPNATTAQAVKALLSWAIDTKGGSSMSFLNQVGFQPLPASIVQLSAAQIAKIKG